MAVTHRIRWEDPPPSRGGKLAATVHIDVAEKLRKRPGQWGVIAVYSTNRAASSAAQMIRSGRWAAYSPAGTYEAVARVVEQESRVYARYIGRGE